VCEITFNICEISRKTTVQRSRKCEYKMVKQHMMLILPETALKKRRKKVSIYYDLIIQYASDLIPQSFEIAWTGVSG
jgi:hypothetical protein